MFPGLDLYYADPAQHHLRTAAEDLEDLDRDLSDLSVQRMNPFTTAKRVSF